MADPKHLELLKKQGVSAWNAWREEDRVLRPDLSEADLSGIYLQGVNLRGADLRGTQFLWARLIEADLRGADLREADFSWADLPWADLREAELAGMSLYEANLYQVNLAGMSLEGMNLAGARVTEANVVRANLVDADLRQANLVDACLDGADLTDAKLWETQRGGWSIKGVVCRRAFWDPDGKEPTEYGDGEFEHLFAERPRIVLRYPGGMSPVDLAMLPLIVERLQAEHPGSKLHIRSVQDDAGGAAVTITVEDLENRDTEVFQAEIARLRGTLAAIQDRLRDEGRLRLAFESAYQAVAQSTLSKLLAHQTLRPDAEQDRTKQPVLMHNVGHITGPIYGEVHIGQIVYVTGSVPGVIVMNRDSYDISGQAGAVGPGAHAHGNTFQQLQSGLDLPRLAKELEELRAHLRQEARDDPEADEVIGAVATAQKAAEQGDVARVVQLLKPFGSWLLDTVDKAKAPLLVEVLKRLLT